MPNTLVSRMCLMYGPPETHDDAAWFREMDRLLAGYSEAILNRAADIVMTTHRGARFPALSVMVEACDRACEESAAKRQPTTYEWPSKVAPKTAEEIAKERDRAEWRKMIVEQHGSMDNFLQKTARGYVARSQPNAASAVRRVLTETSRRMTADQDDLNT